MGELRAGSVHKGGPRRLRTLKIHLLAKFISEDALSNRTIGATYFSSRHHAASDTARTSK